MDRLWPPNSGNSTSWAHDYKQRHGGGTSFSGSGRRHLKPSDAGRFLLSELKLELLKVLYGLRF